MERILYLVAYDIADPGRLVQAHDLLKGYSTGGQKSVFECYLTDGEVREVSGELSSLIDAQADRVHIFQMDGRSNTHAMGIALQPTDPTFFYVG